jgi:hypothetical protein
MPASDAEGFAQAVAPRSELTGSLASARAKGKRFGRSAEQWQRPTCARELPAAPPDQASPASEARASRRGKSGVGDERGEEGADGVGVLAVI